MVQGDRQRARDDQAAYNCTLAKLLPILPTRKIIASPGPLFVYWLAVTEFCEDLEQNLPNFCTKSITAFNTVLSIGHCIILPCREQNRFPVLHLICSSRTDVLAYA